MDKNLKVINDWNTKHTIGTPVHVTKDNGDILATVTTSEAMLLGGYVPVVWVEGIRGCYLLNRVQPKRTEDKPTGHPGFVRGVDILEIITRKQMNV